MSLKPVNNLEEVKSPWIIVGKKRGIANNPPSVGSKTDIRMSLGDNGKHLSFTFPLKLSTELKFDRSEKNGFGAIRVGFNPVTHEFLFTPVKIGTDRSFAIRQQSKRGNSARYFFLHVPIGEARDLDFEFKTQRTQGIELKGKNINGAVVCDLPGHVRFRKA